MAKKTSAKKIAMEVGAGLAAAGAAAAAGYYFYASKGAKKHRKIAAAWATKMKKEVIKEAKLLEKTSPRAFATIVDRVAKTYAAARTVKADDVKRAAKELKENWDMVQRETKHTVRQERLTRKDRCEKDCEESREARKITL